jgi:Sulfotransferase family
MLPNFFIAGAPKSGTTSLYHYLDQHPEIYMSPIKEPHYFASEIRLERFSEGLRPKAEQDAHALRAYLDGPMREKRFGGVVTEWRDYLKLFHQAEAQKAIGEASVCYMWSESAAANIRRAIPDARIILVLRNPVEMAFSMYLQTVASGAIDCTFREAIEMGLDQRGGKIDVMHPFLDLGLYYEQVKRFLAAFPEERVRIYWYEDYQADPARMLAAVFRFLEVDSNFSPDLSKRYLEASMPNVLLDQADRAFLTEFYRNDIRELAGLLRRDLSGWCEVISG